MNWRRCSHCCQLWHTSNRPLRPRSGRRLSQPLLPHPSALGASCACNSSPTTSAVTLQRTTSVPLLLTLPPAALSGCTDSPRHRSSRLNRRSTRITMLTIQISADGTADRMAASVAAKTRSVPSKTQSAQSTISGANATTSSGISCPTGGPIAAAAAAAPSTAGLVSEPPTPSSRHSNAQAVTVPTSTFSFSAAFFWSDGTLSGTSDNRTERAARTAAASPGSPAAPAPSSRTRRPAISPRRGTSTVSIISTQPGHRIRPVWRRPSVPRPGSHSCSWVPHTVCVGRLYGTNAIAAAAHVASEARLRPKSRQRRWDCT
mmetsp:Transcript_25216/g.75921  ORF Transcript_25216/g.75921 Transcript_25216/m.75921 type:complete len:317 (+) Transcript_25216:1100-2050(+)